MAASKYNYLFQIDGIDVYPVWAPNASLRWESDPEFVFKRLKLNGTFTLLNGVRKDFNLVWAKPLDHEFTFLAQYIVDGVVVEEINGTFFKTDCPFWDLDGERVDVVVQTIDKYEKLMKAFDKEFDLVGGLQPESYRVNYKKEPLIQIAFPYHGILYNRVGSSSFETTLPDVYTSVQLEDFGFIHSTPRVFIPGESDMTPDVSGIYEQTAPTQYERLDGVFRISRVETTRWTISEISTGTIFYRGPDGTTPMLDRNPFTVPDDLLLQSTVDTTKYCSPFPIWSHQRILTDSDFVGLGGTVPTIDIPQPDIGDIEFDYLKYVDQSALDPLMISVVPYDLHDVNPTKFGKFNEDAIHFADEYFAPLETYGGAKAYPVLLESWTEYSLMEAINFSFEDEMIEAATTLTLRDAYALADVIQKLLAEIDTNISFVASSFNSQFLFSATNPVTGDPQAITHFITPKSNIIVSNYSQADTREMITFGNIDRLLKAANLFWWIDNAYNFRIEHISYFKNGRSYTTPYIGVDLTTLVEPRTGKYWSFATNNYTYRKDTLPEEYVFSWMDKQSEYFNGYPIKMNSGFVEKGTNKTISIDKFSSDISLAIAFPDAFSQDGFFVLAAELVSGEWTVPYENFGVIPTIDILVQNGWWSFVYLHENFWRHNLPCQSVNINGTDITATTTKRGREQTIRFPSGVNPDPMRLVTSGLGNCEVDEMEINLDSRECTPKLLADLDFDNPCPTC